ncbi:MAG TPA: bifunctional phosphopantothenoylcysteine decarboxylase/phosphopantothenate--cysteine ligase CoaBC [Anaerolineales bacterium]|nr:bifunctional phosphopantothenoylcysteine decarboxylase/phosphopantothenate--cysteine ligase CoaBC [Anaerolineales bacterium]
MTLPSKHILLAVTGSIACYKAIDLASKLTQAGAKVDVILTTAAQKFVSPLAFQAVTGGAVYTDLWGNDAHILHVQLGEQADLLLVAPCTAETLAKLAHGHADNLLTVTALAARCPIAIAPAMDGGMWQNPAVQANVASLQARGVLFWGPAQGRMASGLVGVGRMLEPAELLERVRLFGARNGQWAGKKVVVTAGGTQEAIDPVRYIGNHSSGKQGFAVAQAALELGAQVTLISAPNSLPTPFGATRVDVRSAEQMLAAVLAHTAQADVLVMAAAVADYRPQHTLTQKVKREKQESLQLNLVRNADILLAVAEQKERTGYPGVTVGFAAESQDLLAHAQSKLERKKLDLMVANDITASDAGFFVETNRVILLGKDGSREELPLQSKLDVARALCQRILQLLSEA